MGRFKNVPEILATILLFTKGAKVDRVTILEEISLPSVPGDSLCIGIFGN